MPCRANSVFGEVATSPSGPPSITSTALSCQIVRAPSRTVPGLSASADVVTAHVDPTVVSGVAVHDVLNEYAMSDIVPGSVTDGPLDLSVMRTVVFTCTSPV